MKIEITYIKQNRFYFPHPELFVMKNYTFITKEVIYK